MTWLVLFTVVYLSCDSKEQETLTVFPSPSIYLTNTSNGSVFLGNITIPAGEHTLYSRLSSVLQRLVFDSAIWNIWIPVRRHDSSAQFSNSSLLLDNIYIYIKETTMVLLEAKKGVQDTDTKKDHKQWAEDEGIPIVFL